MIGNIAQGWGQRSSRSTARRRDGYASRSRKSDKVLAKDLRDGIRRAEQRRLREEAIGDMTQLRKFLRRKRTTSAKVFDNHDVRRTGTVSRADLHHVLRGVGVVMSENDLRRALRANDEGQLYEVNGGRFAYDGGKVLGGYAAQYHREKRQHMTKTGRGPTTLSALRDRSNAEDAEAEMVATMRYSAEVAPLRRRLKRADGPMAGYLAPCDFMRVLRDFGASFDATQEEALCERYARAAPPAESAGGAPRGRSEEGRAAERRRQGRWRSPGWSDDSIRMALEDEGPQRQMLEARMVDYERFANELEKRADVEVPLNNNKKKNSVRRTTGSVRGPEGGLGGVDEGLCPPREDTSSEGRAARRRTVRKIASVLESEEQRERWLRFFSPDKDAPGAARTFRASVDNPRVTPSDALAALEALGVELTDLEKPEALQLGRAAGPSTSTDHFGFDLGVVDVAALALNARRAAAEALERDEGDRARLFRTHYSDHDENRLRGRASLTASAPFDVYVSRGSPDRAQRKTHGHSAGVPSRRDFARPSLDHVSRRSRRDRLAFERSTTRAREAASTQAFADALEAIGGADAAYDADQVHAALREVGAPLGPRDVERLLSEATRVSTCSSSSLSTTTTRSPDCESLTVAPLRALRDALGPPPAPVYEPTLRAQAVAHRRAFGPRTSCWETTEEDLRPQKKPLSVDAAADEAITAAIRALKAEPSRTYASSRDLRLTHHANNFPPNSLAKTVATKATLIGTDADVPFGPRRGRGVHRRQDTHLWKFDNNNPDQQQPQRLFAAIKEKGTMSLPAPMIRRAHSEPPLHHKLRADRRLALFCEPRGRAMSSTMA